MLDRVMAAWPASQRRDVTSLIAVSGGADSTALLRALVAQGELGEGRLVVVHFNHRLRGAESSADEAFVRELANQLDLPIDVGHAEETAGPLSEESARDARYQFFYDAARRWGARYLAMAHTADDQVETILHRIFRGTGIGGLAGIPQRRPLSELTMIVRPLLSVRRSEVLEYLRQLVQPFRTDSSNANNSFVRNRIRNELLPWIEANLQPQARDAVTQLGASAGEHAAYLRGHASRLFDESLRSRGNEAVVLSLAPLMAAHALVLRYLLRDLWRSQGWPEQAMGAAEWHALADWVQSTETTSPTLPGGIRGIKEAGEVLFAGGKVRPS